MNFRSSTEYVNFTFFLLFSNLIPCFSCSHVFSRFSPFFARYTYIYISLSKIPEIDCSRTFLQYVLNERSRSFYKSTWGYTQILITMNDLLLRPGIRNNHTNSQQSLSNSNRFVHNMRERERERESSGYILCVYITYIHHNYILKVSKIRLNSILHFVQIIEIRITVILCPVLIVIHSLFKHMNPQQKQTIGSDFDFYIIFIFGLCFFAASFGIFVYFMATAAIKTYLPRIPTSSYLSTVTPHAEYTFHAHISSICM